MLPIISVLSWLLISREAAGDQGAVADGEFSAIGGRDTISRFGALPVAGEVRRSPTADCRLPHDAQPLGGDAGQGAIGLATVILAPWEHGSGPRPRPGQDG